MPCTICHKRTPRRSGSAARALRRADPQVRSRPAKDARYYFNARFYDAERGAFIGRDPKLQFWTPYSYVGNGPLLGIDPDGQKDLGADPNRPNIHVDFTQTSTGEMKFEDFAVSKEVRQYVALMEGGSDPFGAVWNLRDAHWFERVTANGFPPQDETVIANDSKWERLSPQKSIYHMQGGAVGNKHGDWPRDHLCTQWERCDRSSKQRDIQLRLAGGRIRKFGACWA